MFLSSVLDTTAIDEKQVQSFFSKLTLEKLLYAAVLLVLCAVLIRLILKAADKLFAHSKLDHTIFGFLRTAAKAILIFITTMLVAGTLGIDTSSLLAILSVAGLAVSLSVQSSLSNVASAMMILTAKPFRSGDYPAWRQGRHRPHHRRNLHEPAYVRQSAYLHSEQSGHCRSDRQLHLG